MPKSPRLRVMIVDDEMLARQRLEDLLRHEPDVEIVATVDNGQDAVEAIQAHKPDLVFLDVQMPGLTGPEVVQAVGPANMPVTIFVTAYDQYALKAFELSALDYLVKPFDDERFEQTLARSRKLLQLREVESMHRQLLTVLQGDAPAASTTPAAPAAAPAEAYLERIAVEMRGQVRVVPVSQVNYITASGPYVELHTEGNTYVIRERMQTLEDRLDPHHFLRIHRSTIVRLSLIESLLHSAGGDYAVRLKDGVRLKVSRSRREVLEQRLGLDALG